MVCYTALLIFRILQKKFDLAGFHFTPDDIVETLKNMQVTDMDGICYKSTYRGSQILTALNTIYPLSQLDHKYYLPKDLNKKFRKISVVLSVSQQRKRE
jgi:16S rRNA C1402 (ribose-2'-O) methylase RsmI